jgi:hypothetical protein
MTHLIPAFRRRLDVHLDPDSPTVAARMATTLVKTDRESVRTSFRLIPSY